MTLDEKIEELLNDGYEITFEMFMNEPSVKVSRGSWHFRYIFRMDPGGNKRFTEDYIVDALTFADSEFIEHLIKETKKNDQN